MNERERLVQTLCCQPTDRPPLPWWLGFQPWPATLDRWREESGLEDLDPGAQFGFDRYFAAAPIEYGPWPRVPEQILRQDAQWIVSTDFRGITMRSRRDGGSMPEWIAHPVHEQGDWERYKEKHLQPRVDERIARLDEFAAMARETEAAVQVGVYPWGVFGSMRDLLGAEECLLGFYTQPELIRDIMETYTTLWIQLYEEVARRVPIDHVHIWEDMSGKQGSLISMRMVETFMMPCYDRIAEFCRAHQVPVLSVDTDGLVDELVPTMASHGVTAFMPFEVQAGNDILALREQYPTLGLMGGLDKTALAVGGSALHRELDRAEAMFAMGGMGGRVRSSDPTGRPLGALSHVLPRDRPHGGHLG